MTLIGVVGVGGGLGISAMASPRVPTHVTHAANAPHEAHAIYTADKAHVAESDVSSICSKASDGDLHCWRRGLPVATLSRTAHASEGTAERKVPVASAPTQAPHYVAAPAARTTTSVVPKPVVQQKPVTVAKPVTPPQPVATPKPPAPPAPPAPAGTQAVTDQITAVFGPYASQALAIAACESGYNPNARNASSGAAGVFQFLPGTWATTAYASYSPFNAWANINAAHQVFERDGYSWREWQCQP